MKSNVNWIYKVFLLAFIFSVIFSSVSTTISGNIPIVILPIIIITVIAIGILFDMIGVAVLTANEANLHAKASNKLKGAKEETVKKHKKLFSDEVWKDLEMLREADLSAH